MINMSDARSRVEKHFFYQFIHTLVEVIKILQLT